MYCYKYPHPAVAVDCVAFSFQGSKTYVLLVKRGNEPYKDCWALPGGFVNIDESAEDAVVREVEEETGMQLTNVRQLHTYSSPQRDPRERVISIVYTAFVEKQSVKGGDDAAEAEWFQIEELPPLAFDHEMIIEDAISRLKSPFPNLC